MCKGTRAYYSTSFVVTLSLKVEGFLSLYLLFFHDNIFYLYILVPDFCVSFIDYMHINIEKTYVHIAYKFIDIKVQ
jgi:hypothetical protein